MQHMLHNMKLPISEIWVVQLRRRLLASWRRMQAAAVEEIIKHWAL
jgi:hypothetical protein